MLISRQFNNLRKSGTPNVLIHFLQFSVPGVPPSLRKKERAREEFTILVLIEPGALDVEEPEARDKARERQRIDPKRGDRLVRTRVGLVIGVPACRKSSFGR